VLIDIPEKYMPIVVDSGFAMGQNFLNAPIGSIGCLLLTRQIIEKHPDDLEEYLAKFLYGIKCAEKYNE